MNERRRKKALTQRIESFYQALDDADDTLQAADNALDDGHTDEAQRLIAIGRESLAGHIQRLKGLL